MKRIILHIHTFCLLTLLCPAGLAAQSVIRGIVIDRESQLPVEAATVQLTRGNVSFPINYTLSNNEGTFTLTQPKRTDSLLVSVSLLGYQTQQQAVHAGQTLRFEMEPQVFSLKEVEIRPGRVWGRQDTINYDVTRFLSPKDQSIKDVLRKLPGIDIDDLGKISYNGKEIRNFYVEGLDLTNGKYKQISENLRADASDGEPPTDPCVTEKDQDRRRSVEPQTETGIPGSLADQCRRRSRRIPVLMERSR